MLHLLIKTKVENLDIYKTIKLPDTLIFQAVLLSIIHEWSTLHGGTHSY